MTALPAWITGHISNAKYDERGARLRLRGHHNDPGLALFDLRWVLEEVIPPPGYQFSKCEAAVEHKKGPRLSWSVTWIRTSVAEAHRERRRAQRMSRFEMNGEESKP